MNKEWAPGVIRRCGGNMVFQIYQLLNERNPIWQSKIDSSCVCSSGCSKKEEKRAVCIKWAYVSWHDWPMTMWNGDQAVIVLNSYRVPPKSLKSKGNNSYTLLRRVQSRPIHFPSTTSEDMLNASCWELVHVLLGLTHHCLVLGDLKEGRQRFLTVVIPSPFHPIHRPCMGIGFPAK